MYHVVDFIFIVAKGWRTDLTRLTDTRSWPLNEDGRILVNLESLYGTCEAFTSVSFDITYNITTELSELSQQENVQTGPEYKQE